MEADTGPISKKSSGASLGSLVNTSASQSPYKVAASLQLNNHTKWPLKLESCYPKYGKVETVINRVAPGESGIMKMRKTGRSTAGTCGTVEWQLVGNDVSVVVMWSIPYNHVVHSNRLGVGICMIGQNSCETFDDMHYNVNEIYFRRKDFYSVIGPVEYNSQSIKVSGSMGTTLKSDIVIDVEPMDPALRFDFSAWNDE